MAEVRLDRREPPSHANLHRTRETHADALFSDLPRHTWAAALLRRQRELSDLGPVIRRRRVSFILPREIIDTCNIDAERKIELTSLAVNRR